MINRLQVPKAAHFYKKRKNLPRVAIEDMFRSLRGHAENPSRNIFSHVKESHAGVVWSGIAFYYDRDPSFLELPAGYPRERVCGFVLVAEYRDHIAIWKSGLDIPPTFKSTFLRTVAEERVEVAIAKADAVFEQIRLRSMAGSKYALRSKTLEADDLRNVVPPSGTSRFVASVYRLRRGPNHYSATPSTGRISMRSDRVGLTDILEWAQTVVDSLNDDTAVPSPFIRQFARPIDLSNIGRDIVPSYLAVDVHVLREEILEAEAPYRLVRRADEGNFAPLDADETQTILDMLDRAFHVRKVKSELRLLDGDNGPRVGEIRIGKTKISLRSMETPGLLNIHIVHTAPPPGEEPEPISLRRYIDQNSLFTVLFSDLTVVYVEGRLYRDNSIVGGGEWFLRYFKASASLNDSVSEKGTFTQNHVNFDADSIFGAVSVDIAADDEVLVCDDLGDEWADFIGINAASQPKRVSFYHAKHGPVSLGASALHVAVSQAVKNLGRMSLTAASVASKSEKWNSTYDAPGVETSIHRIRKGDLVTLQQQVDQVASSPDTIRRVCIVASSLSLADLVEAFEEIGRGEVPKPHFVQLYWLLTGYFSACLEVNAFPYVICRE